MSYYKNYSFRMGVFAWLAFFVNLVLILISIVFALELLMLGSIFFSIFTLYLHRKIGEKHLTIEVSVAEEMVKVWEDDIHQHLVNSSYPDVIAKSSQPKEIKTLTENISLVRLHSKNTHNDLRNLIIAINQEEYKLIEQYRQHKSGFVRTSLGSFSVN